MSAGSDGASLRPAGDAALLLQFPAHIDEATSARAVAVAAQVRAASLPGVRDVVPTYRSVAVHVDPLVADLRRVEDVLQAAGERAAPAPGRRLDVPVAYGGRDGPDVDAVAAWAGLPVAEVVARHAAPEYRVYMLGFTPGFPYMGTVDARIAMPRHDTPRVRVAAGSVGLAGAQTGIYPRPTPGGWQILGRTDVVAFDADRPEPFLFAPGDRVRFVPVPDVAPEPPRSPARGDADMLTATPGGTGRHLTVVRGGLLTTVQDLGRWGYQARGVSPAGPMDLVSHRVANLLVGNPRDAATIEVTILGPELRVEGGAVLAVTGADLSATLDGDPLPLGRAVRARDGAVVRFGDRRAGARAYVAMGGGVAAPAVLGSRATHVMSGLGGRPLRAGDRLPLGEPTGDPRPGTAPRMGLPRGGTRVRVLPGPQQEALDAETLDRLTAARWYVTPASDRTGYRLAGAVDEPAARAAGGAMISDAAFPGGVQVLPSGQPVLLLADRQTTGGYPQGAIVIGADLPLAGQLAPGDWIEFEPCSRRDAVAALVALEGGLLALE
ncbi:MAG: 5-oxoprolinase subunit PxpB [Vicinamibacterales bacterium]